MSGKGVIGLAWLGIAALVVGGLGAVTVSALQVETAQREGQAQADHSERLRSALWRLDGRLSPTLAREESRPSSHYSALHMPAFAFQRHGTPYPDGAVYLPSPLLGAELPEWVRLHFQVDLDAGWQSPQVLPQRLTQFLQQPRLGLSLANVTVQRASDLKQLAQQHQPIAVLQLVAQRSKIVCNEQAVWLGCAPNLAPIDEEMAKSVSNAEPQQQRSNLGDNRAGAQPAPGQQLAPQITNPNTVKQTNETDSDARNRVVVRGKFDGRGGYDNNWNALDLNHFAGRAAVESDKAALGRPPTITEAPTGDAAPEPQPTGTERKDVGKPAAEKAPADEQKREEAGPARRGDDRMAANRPALPTPPAAPKPVAPLTPVPKAAPAGPPGAAVPAPPVAGGGAVGGKLLGSKPIVRLGPIVPVWLDATAGEQQLLAVRLAETDERQFCQGFLIDWPRLKQVLLDEIGDLFPQADLLPFAATPNNERSFDVLTNLPIRLDPGPVPPVEDAGWTPLRLGLASAWLAALIGLGAVGLGGWSVLDLSERRIRFVSAVTHELRTPLTTLRLYLDLLSSGMVRDEQQRTEYLNTLNAESDRLHRLIGNVLDFARLEKQRPRLDCQTLAPADVLNGLAGNWHERCAAAGKELVVELPPSGPDVCTDVNLVQQIVSNLIDNACKHTREVPERRIWLRGRYQRGKLLLEVEDGGRGVLRGERRSIFRPFCRGRQADISGGVGLGLALAQRWARLLRGTLSLVAPQHGNGACFQLSLPLCAQANG
jgi:signal transduction histidine kinase